MDLTSLRRGCLQLITELVTPGRGKTTRIVHINFLKKWTTPSAQVLVKSDECLENDRVI